MTRTRWLAALLAGLTMLVAACSTTTSGNAFATAPTAGQLNRLVLRASDFPAGTKSEPNSSGASDKQTQRQLLDCVGGRNTEPDRVAHVDAPQFTLDDGTVVSSSASSYKSQSDIDADVAILQSPKINTCYEKILRETLQHQVEAGVTVTSVNVTFAKGGAGQPKNVVATGTASIGLQANGQRTSVFATIAFITGSLIGAQVECERVGQAPSPGTVASYVKIVADRVAKA